MKKKGSRRPFYNHAAICWPFYAREAGENCCRERIHDLFQLPTTHGFCLWATTLAAQSMGCNRRSYSLDEWLSSPSFNNITMSFQPSHFVRPDFTPLHMAAAMGIPDLCRYLLSQRVNVNAKGVFGTPLHCAIAGLRVFMSPTEECRRSHPPRAIDHAPGRLQVVRILLEAGANPKLHFTGYIKQPISCLSLTMFFAHFEPELEIAAELIKAGGVNVEEEDVTSFQVLYGDPNQKHYWDVDTRYSVEQAVMSFLEALGPPDIHSEPTPRAHLYNRTLKWTAMVGIEDLSAVSTFQLTDEASDRQIIKIISFWIETNDDIELSRFLETSRSELVKSLRFDLMDDISRKGTALHLAASVNSLDALNTLLNHGICPDIVNEDGESPIHLCGYDEDALQALLRYGASTLLQDKNLETIWHKCARLSNQNLLIILVELDTRQEGLQMVSSQGETPICTALNCRHNKSVLLLFKYCDSKEFWRSGKSIFRAAAELGSFEVVQHLLDLGIEVDGMDDMTGNPLHYLTPTAAVECIQLLKSVFPLEQRRKKDFRTPLESLLLRAASTPRLDPTLFETMIPSAARSESKEASSLWSFVTGSVAIRSIGTGTYWYSRHSDWFTHMVSTLIKVGIMAKYEGERGESALLPIASTVVRDVIGMYRETGTAKALAMLLGYYAADCAGDTTLGHRSGQARRDTTFIHGHPTQRQQNDILACRKGCRYALKSRPSLPV